MIRPEYKHVAPARLNKVVAALVYKDLVACVDCSSGNDLAAMTNPTGKNVEIVTERLGRRVNKKVLPAADQSRKCEKEQNFLGHNLDNLILLLGNHVNVIATENNELADLSQNVWRQLRAGMTDDSV